MFLKCKVALMDIQLINTYQCMVFESNGQSMSKLCWSILIGTGTVSAGYALVIATGLIDGLYDIKSRLANGIDYRFSS